jgi:hypothetical protein
MSYMNLANRLIFTSILKMTFSILLDTEVIKSHSRILGNFKTEENEYYFSNIRLAVTSICLNIIYILFQTPISIHLIQDYSSMYFYIISYFLYYVSYSINFYVILIPNSLFRKEFILLLKKTIQIILNIRQIKKNVLFILHNFYI